MRAVKKSNEISKISESSAKLQADTSSSSIKASNKSTEFVTSYDGSGKEEYRISRAIVPPLCTVPPLKNFMELYSTLGVFYIYLVIQ